MNVAEEALAAANAKRRGKAKEEAVKKAQDKVASRGRELADAKAKLEVIKSKHDAAVAAAAAKAAKAAAKVEDTKAFSEAGLIWLVTRRIDLQPKFDDTLHTSENLWLLIHKEAEAEASHHQGARRMDDWISTPLPSSTRL